MPREGEAFRLPRTPLADGDVEFVVVGGLAAVVHGSAYVTHDVDVCNGRSATKPPSE